jgi:hypothetical protein
MTVTEPIPDLQWGRGDWQDYINNWREKDAEFLQARTILRYQTAAARTTDWPAPQPGQVTYNNETQTLEMWRPAASSWVRSLMFQYLTATQDSAAGVKMSHVGAAGKGILIQPASLVIDIPLNVQAGLLQVGADFVGIQSVGQKLAKLTTDSDELLSDTPLAISAIRLTGTGTVLDAATKAVTVGPLTAGSLTSTGAVSTTGTVTGGVVNGTTGTIGGVALNTNAVQPSAGMQSQQGYFYGDSNSAVMRQRPTLGGASSPNYVQVTADRVNIGGGTGYMDVYPTFRLFGGRGIHWIDAGGTHRAWISPTIVSASDPGAGNYPDGTIWIIP